MPAAKDGGRGAAKPKVKVKSSVGSAVSGAAKGKPRVSYGPAPSKADKARQKAVAGKTIKGTLKPVVKKKHESLLERAGKSVGQALEHTPIGPAIHGARAVGKAEKVAEPVIPKSVKDAAKVTDKALQGDYVLKPAAKALRDAMEKGAPGVGHTMAALASGPTKPGAGGTKRLAAKPAVVVTDKQAKAAAEPLKRVANDAIDLAANAVPSVYVPARQLVHDKGNPTKAAKMVGEPVYNTFKSPKAFKKAATEHPLQTGLLISGARGAITYGAGKALRTAPSKTTREYASTKREPKTAEGLPLRVERKHPKGIVGNRISKRRDARKPVPEPTPQDLKHAADVHVGVQQDMARLHRAKTAEATVKALRDPVTPTRVPGKGRVKQSEENIAATSVAAQGIASRAELPGLLVKARAAEHRMRDEIAASTDKGQRAQIQLRLDENLKNQAILEKAIKSKSNGTDTAAARYAAVNVGLQEGLGKRQIVEPARGERARLIPYAVAKMGAKHDSALGLVDKHGQPLPSEAIRAHMAAAHSGSHVMYHVVRDTAVSAKAKLKKIRTEGLKPTAGAGAVYLYDNLGDATRFAGGEGHILPVDVRGLDVRGAGATRTVTGGVPAKHLLLDVPDPAYVTHAPGQGGNKNFGIGTSRTGKPTPSISPVPRTGKAVSDVTLPLGKNTLMEANQKAQGLIDAHDAHADMLREVGFHAKDPKTGKPVLVQRPKFEGPGGIQELVRAENAKGGVQWRAVRATVFSDTQAHLKQLVDDARTSPEQIDVHVNDALREAIKPSETNPGDGPWAMVPDAFAQRVMDHLDVNAATTFQKASQALGSQARKVVLVTNPKWIAGNVVEPGMVRAPIAHAGPRSKMTQVTFMDELTQTQPRKAEMLASATMGGGNISMTSRMAVKQTVDRYRGTRLEPVAKALHYTLEKPGPKQIAGLWNVTTHLVFDQLNGRFERGMQGAFLGKALREHPLLTEQGMRLSNEAIRQAAHGKIDLGLIVRLSDEVKRGFGQYDSFGPSMRKAVQGLTPFVPWYFNALRFLFSVLPKDHPVATSLLVAANQATEDWRKEHGQVTSVTGGGAPAYLQGSIPGKDGTYLRVSRYMPFGAAADPLGTAASSVLSLAGGVLNAAEGLDWKNSPLAPGRDATLAERGLAVAAGAGDVLVPGMSQTRRLIQGRTPRQVFDPFLYTSPAKSKGTSVRVRKSSGVKLGGSSKGSGVKLGGGSSTGGVKLGGG